jgi:hypothetical protein
MTDPPCTECLRSAFTGRLEIGAQSPLALSVHATGKIEKFATTDKLSFPSSAWDRPTANLGFPEPPLSAEALLVAHESELQVTRFPSGSLGTRKALRH